MTSNVNGKVKNEKKKIMIAGTFDIIHPGHLYLINEASKLGEVTVIVGTDEIVTKLKGKKPIIPEVQRVFIVNSIKGVKKAILGKKSTDFSTIISEVKPDLILMGPDQGPNNEKLKEIIKSTGLSIEIKRLDSRINNFPLTSTTSIIKEVKSRANCIDDE
ncbi:MAG: adenylyltransferase/cytidyltransferase family protein [Promethearchaeota archaeon]